ncbi:MAG: dipeptidase [Lachnospiraceae bacterium]|nr:dipeptidase [Lachnospiraceae bacterium]
MQVVDMHCDTISRLWDLKERGEEESLFENSGHVDVRRLQKSGYLLQNFALFVEKKKCADPWEKVLQLYEVYKQELEKNGKYLAPVYCYEDIGKNKREGKISAMLTVEEGAVCKGDLEKLQELYHMGVRMLTLTWNYPNELGYPNLDSDRGREIRSRAEDEEQAERDTVVKEYLNTPEERGLTETGLFFLERMENLGMIVDVSHLSDGGFYDVLTHTKKPFVASHSNARALCPCARNLSDDMIRKLAERGGVAGLNFCADFLVQKPVGEQNPGTVADIVRHAAYLLKTGGEDCLGLGSDFDGIDTHEELPGADKIELLWEALKQHGFTQRQLDKVFGQNVLRVYREIL